MMNFKDKTIILAVPNHFGLPNCFRKNLEALGFQVFEIPHDSSKKIKISKRDALIHFIKKTFLGEKTYKAELLTNLKSQPQIDVLSPIEKSDFALVIRPDLFSESVLNEIKKKSTFSVAYQWDGMERFPLAESRIKFFNRFFVFDENDVEKFPGTIHTTNFYFDYLPANYPKKQDVFFVGTFMKDRIADIAKISLELSNLGLNTNINILYDKEKKIEIYRNYPINFIKKGFTFEEAMIESKSSDILLDVENLFHKGFSFRCFDAIGYGKKLITNNHLVKDCDFYNPQNIFVLEDNLHLIKDFVEGNSVIAPLHTMEKYSFTAFIQRIFQNN